MSLAVCVHDVESWRRWLSFSIPVFLPGFFLRSNFAVVHQSSALGANILRAVMGGLMENISLVVGMRALLLVALGFYSLAAWAALRTQARAPVLVKTARVGA